MGCFQRPSMRKRHGSKKGSNTPIEGLRVADLILLAGLDLPSGFDVADPSAVPAVRDMSALIDIVAQGEKYVEIGGQEGVRSLCAWYAYSLIERRPFQHGLNYPAAMRTVPFVLLLNGWENPLSVDDWKDFLTDLARGDITEEQLAQLIAALTSPRHPTA